MIARFRPRSAPSGKIEPCMRRHDLDREGRRHRSSGEQDRAAGSRAARKISTDDGRVATASIELKQFHPNGAVWAYLRWSIDGKTTTRYLGRVEGGSRLERLRNGWALARESGTAKTSPLPRRSAS